MYDHHESYKHKLAKELLYSWIYNAEKENGEFCPQLPFSWRPGNYGVHLELPFFTGSDPYYFELSKGIIDHEGSCYDVSKKGFDINTRFNDDRGRFLFVPDITIFHKGCAQILIEVFHSNPVSNDKIKKIDKFFNGHYVELWEISADNILSQTNKRHELIFTQVDLPSQIYR